MNNFDLGNLKTAVKLNPLPLAYRDFLRIGGGLPVKKARSALFTQIRHTMVELVEKLLSV